MLGQIEEFPADLLSCEVEEMAHRINPHRLEGTMQTQHGILENIIGFFPAPEGGKAVEHFAREAAQALACVSKQFIMCRWLAMQAPLN